ncbi:MAG: hypothetical protein AAGJ84_14740, partial [Pseudomonadota bacterium]
SLPRLGKRGRRNQLVREAQIQQFATKTGISRMPLIVRTLAISLCITLGSLPGAAEGWVLLRKNYYIDGADRDSIVDYTLRTQSVFYRGEGVANLMLTCSDRSGLMVSFGLDDIDFEARTLDTTGRIRRVRIKLLIDDDRSSGIQSVHLPTLKVVEPIAMTPARKVFNSVVRQVPVELSMPGKGKFTYTLPPIDDAFRRFANSCAVTGG